MRKNFHGVVERQSEGRIDWMDWARLNGTGNFFGGMNQDWSDMDRVIVRDQPNPCLE
jgi:hypothetical protein